MKWIAATSLLTSLAFASPYTDSKYKGTFEKLGQGDSIAQFSKETPYTDKEKQELLQLYLEHLQEQVGKIDQSFLEPQFNVYLKVADALFPKAKICDYFYDCYYKNIANVDGLNRILEILNGQPAMLGRLGKAKALPLNSLIKELTVLTPGPKSNGQHQFLVHVDGKHMTPVLVQVEEKPVKQITVLILDSLGDCEGGHRHSNNIAKLIASELPSKSPLTIFKYLNPRQRDGQSCPIFTLSDVIYSTQIDLFAYLAQLKAHDHGAFVKGCSDDPRVYQVSALPPEFSKIIQTVEELRRILEEGLPFHEKEAVEEMLPRPTVPFKNPDARTQSFHYYGLLVQNEIARLVTAK